MLRQVIRVSKFWREYAGHLAVEAIDDKVMREFIPWRRDYYASFKTLPKNAKRHPADRTIQFEMLMVDLRSTRHDPYISPSDVVFLTM